MNRNAAAILLFCAAAALGSNLANPAAQIQDARVSVGASYAINGFDITNMEIPMMVNRFCLRVSYAPIRYVNFGLDGGTILADVERYRVPGGIETEYGVMDTVPVFEGNFGWIVGGHLKLSTPYLLNRVSLFGLANGNVFRSKNDAGAYYGGNEGIGVIGAQVRIPKFGFISVGPQVHLIQGRNKSYTGEKSRYSNTNNVRGWIAIDYFPETHGLTGSTIPYASLEFSMSPEVNSSDRVPVREFGISVSIGAISKRLYGADKEALEF